MLMRSILLAPALAFVLGIASARGQDKPATPEEPKKDEPKKDEPKKDEPKKDEPAKPDAPAAKKTRKSVGFEAPAEWKSAKKGGSERGPKAAYKVDAAEGDSEGADATLWYSPKRTLEETVKFWCGQFKQPDGAAFPADKVKTEKLEVNGIKITTIEIAGTYAGRSRGKKPAEPKPGAKVLVAFVEAPDGGWSPQLLGPEKTVEKNRDAFMKWIKSAHEVEREEEDRPQKSRKGENGGGSKKPEGGEKKGDDKSPE